MESKRCWECIKMAVVSVYLGFVVTLHRVAHLFLSIPHFLFPISPFSRVHSLTTSSLATVTITISHSLEKKSPPL